MWLLWLQIMDYGGIPQAKWYQASYFIGAYLRSVNLARVKKYSKRMIENLVRQDGYQGQLYCMKNTPKSFYYFYLSTNFGHMMAQVLIQGFL